MGIRCSSELSCWAPLWERGRARPEKARREVIKTVYHCTTKEACESIVRGGFRFPTESDARSKGLKLGAAVYFGVDPEYCKHEALNTLAGGNEANRRNVASTLALVQARVRLGKTLSLGDYGQATSLGYKGLTAQMFEEMTECLTHEKLQFYDYDTVTIYEGRFQAEVAVYEPSSIIDMKVVGLASALARDQLEEPHAPNAAAINTVMTVYHCTTREACESILRQGFRLPTEEDAHAKGLKLGAAAYFGVDPEYCKHEALNSLADGDEDLRKETSPQLAMLHARVRLGRALSLGDYGSATRAGHKRLSAKDFERMSESLTKETLQFFGYDTVTIYEGGPNHEVAVYNATDSILQMRMADLPI